MHHRLRGVDKYCQMMRQPRRDDEIKGTLRTDWTVQQSSADVKCVGSRYLYEASPHQRYDNIFPSEVQGEGMSPMRQSAHGGTDHEPQQTPKQTHLGRSVVWRPKRPPNIPSWHSCFAPMRRTLRCLALCIALLIATVHALQDTACSNALEGKIIDSPSLSAIIADVRAKCVLYSCCLECVPSFYTTIAGNFG